ncbi:C3a anaphylatoxin chemotactic receptor-like isoform X2 [Triplophysa rosa]|uniref:C3a anaphylatoxin chemotactic receptor-like isoform X2 n=1 Tax=Triplophysa rosa TaxID=992332 RepID=UPI002545DBD3|nr:C3a anaphylatoxin chemotactic receptor-like isoform X2 [Triplophysa rosa]
MANSTLGPQNLSNVERNHSTDLTGLSNTEIFSICTYFVILVTGVIGNGLVIFVTGYKMKTTVNSIWFLNLAIADFIFILFLILYIVVTFYKMVWPFGDVMCKITSLVSILKMFASIFLLTAISLDRCLCTWVVVWAQNKRTLVKARIICVFVWLSSICCSIPFVINRSVQKNIGFEYCVYSSPINVIMSLFIYRFTVGFVIPFLIIASSYIAIGVRAKRLKRGKQLRPFRVIIPVILAFFMCWFPFHVQQLCLISALKNHWSDSVQEGIEAAGPFVTCLAYLNSCLNPILYVFMCDEFKEKLKKSLLLVLEGAFTEEHMKQRHCLSLHSHYGKNGCF